MPDPTDVISKIGSLLDKLKLVIQPSVSVSPSPCSMDTDEVEDDDMDDNFPVADESTMVMPAGDLATGLRQEETDDEDTDVTGKLSDFLKSVSEAEGDGEEGDGRRVRLRT